MENKIKQILAEVFEIDVNAINENSDSSNIENWDSLNHMNLIVTLEEEFEVEIDEDEISNLMSYSAISKLITTLKT